MNRLMFSGRRRAPAGVRQHLCVQWIICCLVVSVTGAESRSAESNYRKSSYTTPSPTGYSFAFAVRDEPTYKDHSHQETSDGHVVRGSYRVALPDGRVQVVNYRADRNGYVADVTYEGDVSYSPASGFGVSNHPVPHYQHSNGPKVSAATEAKVVELNDPVKTTETSSSTEAKSVVDLPSNRRVQQLAESEVAKIGDVEDSTDTPEVNEPVNEPATRIRPIKLALPKPTSEVVTPGPVGRTRPIKLTYPRPAELAKSFESTPKIRPIKLTYPKPKEQGVATENQTGQPVETNRSTYLSPKLALKRPFPKPIVEQTPRPKTTDGILKPIYPRPLLPKLGSGLAFPKPLYSRPALPKPSPEPLSFKKVPPRPKPEIAHLKAVYPKISTKSTVFRRPSNIAFPKPNLYTSTTTTTTTTTTETPTTETVSLAVESETVDVITESVTDAPVTDAPVTDAPVTESFREGPSAEAIGELVVPTTTEAPVSEDTDPTGIPESATESATELATESFMESRDDNGALPIAAPATETPDDAL